MQVPNAENITYFTESKISSLQVIAILYVLKRADIEQVNIAENIAILSHMMIKAQTLNSDFIHVE